MAEVEVVVEAAAAAAVVAVAARHLAAPLVGLCEVGAKVQVELVHVGEEQLDRARNLHAVELERVYFA